MGRLIFYVATLIYHLVRRDRRTPLDRRSLWDLGVLITFSLLLLIAPPLAMPVLVFGLMVSADALGRWFSIAMWLGWCAAQPELLLATPLALAMAMPWAAAGLAARRGWDRAAAFLGSRGLAWSEHPDAGATVAAAWAVIHRGGPALTRVQARLARAPRVGGAELLASGLLASASGDEVAARRMIESVLRVSDASCPPAARRLAVEWLDADAAARADWAAICGRAALPHSRAGRLLLAIARRRTGADLGGTAPLWMAWLQAPHRLATRPLVAAALRAPPPRPPVVAPAAASASPDSSAADDGDDTALAGDPLAAALRCHALALSSAGVDAAALARLAAAWDKSLDGSEARLAAGERAVALGAPSGDAALRAVRDAVIADLVALARQHEHPLEPLLAGSDHASAILAEAARRLRNQLLGEIELAFTALAGRHGAGRALPAADEWREFLALCAAYEHAARLGGLELRRLAFPHVYLELQAFAVALWNDRGQHVLANAMFCWLRDEARVVGDASAIELLEQNCAVRV